MPRASCVWGAAQPRGWILVSLLPAHSPGWWGQEWSSRTGSPLEDRAQLLFLDLSAYSAEEGNVRWEKTVRRESKNQLYQTKLKCFQFQSGKERLKMTSSQVSLIHFCYNHYIEPSNPLAGKCSLSILTQSLWATLSIFSFKIIIIIIIIFSSLFLNHSLYNSCFSH